MVSIDDSLDENFHSPEFASDYINSEGEKNVDSNDASDEYLVSSRGCTLDRALRIFKDQMNLIRPYKKLPRQWHCARDFLCSDSNNTVS